VIYLLDVSVLLALLLETHVHHDRVTAWAEGKQMALCPITELGFIRISVAVYKSTMAQARQTLLDFQASDAPLFIPASISALAGIPAPDSKKSTDWYLANLAAVHGMKWATLDSLANHPAAELL